MNLPRLQIQQIGMPSIYQAAVDMEENRPTRQALRALGQVGGAYMAQQGQQRKQAELSRLQDDFMRRQGMFGEVQDGEQVETLPQFGMSSDINRPLEMTPAEVRTTPRMRPLSEEEAQQKFLLELQKRDPEAAKLMAQDFQRRMVKPDEEPTKRRVRELEQLYKDTTRVKAQAIATGNNQEVQRQDAFLKQLEGELSSMAPDTWGKWLGGMAEPVKAQPTQDIPEGQRYDLDALVDIGPTLERTETGGLRDLPKLEAQIANFYADRGGIKTPQAEAAISYVRGLHNQGIEERKRQREEKQFQTQQRSAETSIRGQQASTEGTLASTFRQSNMPILQSVVGGHQVLETLKKTLDGKGIIGRPAAVRAALEAASAGTVRFGETPFAITQIQESGPLAQAFKRLAGIGDNVSDDAVRSAVVSLVATYNAQRDLLEERARSQIESNPEAKNAIQGIIAGLPGKINADDIITPKGGRKPRRIESLEDF